MNRKAENPLLGIPYLYNPGLRTPLQIMYDVEPPQGVNCFGLVAEFFHTVRGRLYTLHELLPEESYLNLGKMLFESTFGLTNEQINSLHFGDILYSLPLYQTDTIEVALNWRQQLHMAIFIGGSSEQNILKYFPEIDQIDSDEPLIFHATAIKGTEKSALWPLSKFRESYMPVAAKRVF